MKRWDYLQQYRHRQRLETKVDNLYNLLSKPGSNLRDVSSDDHVNIIPTPSPKESPKINYQSDSHLDCRSDLHANEFDGQCLLTAAEDDHHGHEIQNDEPSQIQPGSRWSNFISMEQAETLFILYRQNLAPEFPFVTFLPTENIQTLQQDRPLLLQAIITVTSTKDPRTQRILGREFMKIIHSKMMFRSNYSLDLLQALQVFTTWYHFFFHPNTQQYALLVNFCNTLVHELGLDTCQNESREDKFIPTPKPVTKTTSRISEAYRALLGMYILSSA